MVKVGYACGVCPKCGKKICRPRPANYAVCDCWKYCPLDGKKMEPFNPSTYPFYTYALSFDGVDDYVKSPHDASLAIEDIITIEAWINPITLSNNRALVRKVSNIDGYELRLVGTKLNFVVRESNTILDTISSISHILTGTWIHVMAICDGTSLRLYINGALDNSKTSSSGLKATNTTDLKIFSNSYWATSKYYHGFGDEMRIYNRVLEPTEIKNRFNGELAGEDALVLWMHFNEKTAKDHSGQGNDGTIYGAEFIEGGRPVKNPVPTGVGYDTDKGLEIIMWHNSPNDHTQPYYSKQKPIEVHLT